MKFRQSDDTSNTNNLALILTGLILAAFLIVNFIFVESRAPAWQDEVFVQSTARSMVSTGQQGLSVLAMYRDSIPPARFYGPVSFEAAAALQRAFGLREWPWRAVCYLLGLALIAVSSAIIIRLAGASSLQVMLGTCVTTVAGVYCTQPPGRWDPVTAGLAVSAIASVMFCMRGSGWQLLPRAVLAGLLFGLAAGSTPRALPILASAGIAIVVGAIIGSDNRAGILGAGLVTGVAAFATDAIVLAPIGMTPWGWLAFVRRASARDRFNSSPLLGGAWNLELSSHKIVIVLSLLMLAVGVASAFIHARSEGNSHEYSNVRIVITVLALVNCALSLTLLSRFLSYAVFWLPLLAIASFSQLPGGSWLVLKKLRPVICILLTLELALPTALQMRRLYEGGRLWATRDPKRMQSEMRKYIPAHSVVFGPVGGYFFPVEQNGSRYLYLKEETTPGLASGMDSSAYREQAVDYVACTRRTYLVWPCKEGGPRLPVHVASDEKVLVNPRRIDSNNLPAIYRLKKPRNCDVLLNEGIWPKVRF
ncbi:MAG TPA: hypothetical protein VFI20_09000 [Terracidiphilus sp.]|nr:hypothetical protein [Terracidiphilus sp.]